MITTLALVGFSPPESEPAVAPRTIQRWRLSNGSTIISGATWDHLWVDVPPAFYEPPDPAYLDRVVERAHAFTRADFFDAVQSLSASPRGVPVLIAREADCLDRHDYRPATEQERAATPGLHGYAFNGAVQVYEPTWSEKP